LFVVTDAIGPPDSSGGFLFKEAPYIGGWIEEEKKAAPPER
jgi:hypothetical protein